MRARAPSSVLLLRRGGRLSRLFVVELMGGHVGFGLSWLGVRTKSDEIVGGPRGRRGEPPIKPKAEGAHARLGSPVSPVAGRVRKSSASLDKIHHGARSGKGSRGSQPVHRMKHRASLPRRSLCPGVLTTLTALTMAPLLSCDPPISVARSNG